MKATQSFKVIGTVAVLGAIVLSGMLISPRRAQAQESMQTLSAVGFAIAPVNLNPTAFDPLLVGYGSYLVNAIGDCNGCHSSGAPPLFLYPFSTGGNPYFSQPKKIDPNVYLNGGANFFTVGTPTGPLGYAGPNIISRNLTPNYAGMPEGGHTLAQFIQILRTGVDLDHIHPNCTAEQITFIMGNDNPNVPNPSCIPTGPIPTGPSTSYDNIPNGNLLQVMPWTTFQNMTDTDLEAIYAYLSAIPCINNTTSTPPQGAPTELLNSCSVAKPAEVKGSEAQQSPRSPRLH